MTAEHQVSPPLKAVGCTPLIMIEASPSILQWYADLGKKSLTKEEETSGDSTPNRPHYCGIALHARTMSVCILNHDGEIVRHRNMNTSPAMFLQAIAPYRADIGVAVEGLFPWSWLADLWAREQFPFVLGHALSMQAIHGGKAQNDKIAAQKIAVLLRGGMLPQAYVSPAKRRATRDLLRSGCLGCANGQRCSRTSSILTTSIPSPRSARSWPTRRTETGGRRGSLTPPCRRTWP